MTWHRRAVAGLVAALGIVALLLVVPQSPIALYADDDRPRTTTTSSRPSTTTSALPTTTAPPSPPTTTAPAPPPLPHSVMLIGDSIAFTASLGLAPEAGHWSFTVVNEGINGCGVVRGGPYRYFGAQRDMEPRCEDWPALWEDAIARHHPHLIAIVVGRWELMDRVHQGQWTNVFDPAFALYVESEIERAVALAVSGGGRVVLFTSPYYRRGTPPGGGLFPEDDPARVDIVNERMRRVAARWNLPVIDVGARLSPGGTYTRVVDGIRVRSDGVHLTRQAGQVLAPWIFPQLQLAMGGPLPAPPPPPPVAPSTAS